MTHGPDQRDLTGLRAGKLTVTGPAANAEEYRGRSEQRPWLAVCDCGQTLTVIKRRLVGKRISCGECGYRFGRPRVAVASYKAWHKRLKSDRGPASIFSCHDCSNPAHEWSYENNCSDEQVEDGLPYCTHLEHYVARCRACHQTLDHRHRYRFRQVRDELKSIGVAR